MYLHMALKQQLKTKLYYFTPCVFIEGKRNYENIKNFLVKWFEIYLIQSYNKQTYIQASSNILSEFIKSFVNNNIPNESFIAPTEFIIGLLNGYFSGNSYITPKSINTSSTSKSLTR